MRTLSFFILEEFSNTYVLLSVIMNPEFCHFVIKYVNINNDSGLGGGGGTSVLNYLVFVNVCDYL